MQKHVYLRSKFLVFFELTSMCYIYNHFFIDYHKDNLQKRLQRTFMTPSQYEHLNIYESKILSKALYYENKKIKKRYS